MNWGIIGYGEISPSFIQGLTSSQHGRLVAIASRSAFDHLKDKVARDISVFRRYEDLLALESVQIVYICTTNNLHYENVKASLEAGKHVLCEKPLTPTYQQTNQLISLATSLGLFLMEGMWTRFLPAYKRMKYLLKEGAIGVPKLLKADFGFYNTWPEHRRLLNPLLYGGTLLDNADYNIFLSQDVFQQYPIEIAAQATFAKTGVEDSCSVIMKYGNGGMAQLFSSFRCRTLQEALIYGEKGYIKLNEYWHGTEIELNLGESMQSWKFPFRNNGFEYEIDAVEETIENGSRENDLIPHHTSKSVALIIDEIKQQIAINEQNTFD